MQQILLWAANNWGYIALALSLFIDWTPSIKWNPWKTFFGWIGKMITKPLMSKIEGMEARLDDVIAKQEQQEKEADENEMDRIRSEVLDFANSCRLKRRHTKEEFDHIFALNDKYQALLEKTGQQNGRFEDAFEYIRVLNRRCMEQNDYLQ